MANAVYPKFKQSLLDDDANISLNESGDDDAPYAALIDTGTYTYNAAHQYYSDLSGVVGTPVKLTSPTITNGLFDAADSTFSAVTGNSAEALVIYRKNSGANSTWRLFAYIDTGVTGLPVTPNGGDINVTWNASGIVQL